MCLGFNKNYKAQQKLRKNTVQRGTSIIRTRLRAQMLEISDKEFKITMISNLKALEGKVYVSRILKSNPTF